ncbi:MAG: glucan 1,4-alpha-maltotetraohydrolase domain-containing protein [Luteibacter jiangsuensis]
MKTRHVVLIVVALLAGAAAVHADDAGKTASGVRYHGGDEILLQGFHWNSTRVKPGGWYAELKSRAAQIAADGFTSVWMPPPWRDTSSWKDDAKGTSGGGEGYFWKDFDKNSGYGTDADLRAAVAALNGAHVKPVFDIVPNHRDAKAEGSTLSIPAGKGRLRTDSCDGRPCDDGDPFMDGSSDLNLANADNEAMFAAELKSLHDTYGAGGFRFDFVRGYAARHVDDLMKSSDDGGFCVGEFWKGPSEFPEGDPNRSKSWQDLLMAWSDQAKCTVFDFALKERMQNGSVPDWRYGLNGNPQRSWREVATTFVDNHDTGYSPGLYGGQHHWALRSESLRMAYAFILTTPGTPTVYWPDMYEGATATPLHDYLRRLIAIRRDAGVRAGSDVSFNTDQGGLVARVTGTRQTVVVALDSRLTEPRVISDQSFVPALEDDGGKVRVWESGTVTPVDVNFRCDKGETTKGRSVYVVGGSKELGLWKLEDAVKLEPAIYPTWKGTVSMAPAFATEWKCVIRDETGTPDALKATAAWEPGDNNQVTPAVGASAEGSF